VADAGTPAPGAAAPALSPAPAPAGGLPAWKLGLLGTLYFAQGLPFGFQTKALPLFLTSAGASLTTVSLSYALSLAWGLKLLWAPLVDRFGRRKSWLVPLQLGLAGACLLAAAAAQRAEAAGGGTRGLALVLAAVALMNLLAATQDVAADGLAVDLLHGRELGAGNAAQVTAYKLGTLAAGAGLALAADRGLGWGGAFTAMAALSLLALPLVALYREPPRAARPGGAGRTLRQVLAELGRALRLPGSGWLLLFIATYKLGESMGDVMLKPFLLRGAGFSVAQVAGWDLAFGTPASIAGSLLGGLLAARLRPLQAVGWAAGLRTLPQLGRLWLALTPSPTAGEVLCVVVAEELLGGMLTTAMFAFMMSRVDPRVGASHFTALAAVEVWGKSPAGWLSGPVADAWGFPALFALAALLSAAFLLLLLPLRGTDAPRALPRHTLQ
jgi:MFS family permease